MKITGNEGRVAAFEPLPRCYRELVSQFKRSNVQIGNFALSHYANPAVAFTEATGTPQESGLKRRNFNHPERANPRQIIVQVSTLDRQIGTWQRLDYLKIDIEGGELDCLEGGEEIVTRCRPVISFECGFDAYEHYGKTSIDFLEYARGHRLTWSLRPNRRRRGRPLLKNPTYNLRLNKNRWRNRWRSPSRSGPLRIGTSRSSRSRSRSHSRRPGWFRRSWGNWLRGRNPGNRLASSNTLARQAASCRALKTR